MMLVQNNVVPYLAFNSRRQRFKVMKQKYEWQIIEKASGRVVASWADKETAHAQCLVLNKSAQGLALSKTAR
jgi:hypothetical protein